MSAQRSSIARPAASKAPADIAAMVEAMPQACIATHPDGAIACLNRRAASLFGYEGKDLTGRDVSVLLSPKLAPKLVKKLAHASDGKLSRTWRRPLNGRHANGAEVPVLVSMSCAHLSGGDLFLALVEPHDQLAHVSEYIDSAVDATVIICENGLIAAFNRAAETLFGMQRDEAIGTNVSSLMPASFGVHHNNYLSHSQKVHEGGKGNALGIRRPVYARTASGEEFRVSIALNESWLAGQRYYTGVVTRMDDSETAVHLDALKGLLEASLAPSIVIDEKGLVAEFNRAAENMFGFGKGDMVGRNVSALMPPEYAGEHGDNLNRFRAAKRADASRAVGMRRPVVAQHRDGRLMPVRIAVSELQLPGNKYYLGVIAYEEDDTATSTTTRVVEELVAKRTRSMAKQLESLKKLSRTDELTQMANRREFDATLKREVSRSSRSREVISLAMLDIDHFKLYNDEYGHPGGDACLKQVAACIRNVYRRLADLPARYGGEEFGIVMAGTSFDNAVMLGNRLRDRIATASIAHATSPTASHVTISIGVCSIVPDPSDAASDIIEMADAALYHAKETGRDRVVGDDRSYGAEDTSVD